MRRVEFARFKSREFVSIAVLRHSKLASIHQQRRIPPHSWRVRLRSRVRVGRGPDAAWLANMRRVEFGLFKIAREFASIAASPRTLGAYGYESLSFHPVSDLAQQFAQAFQVFALDL
jgi:hypothetical protein